MWPASSPLGPVLVVAAAAGGILASIVLSGAAMRLLRRLGAIDVPDARRAHAGPTPRGGGIAVVAVWATWLLALASADPGPWPMLAAAALALAALGLVDDLCDLPSGLRFAIQLLVAAPVLAGLSVGGGAAAGGHMALGPWLLSLEGAGFGLALLATLAAINFYNFMDGIDGMAGQQALFAASVLAALSFAAGDAVLALACIGLAAAVAGFLPWNFPRARLFLGDAGSTALGFAFALLGILGALRGAWSLALPVLVLAPFVVDAAATLLWRMARGQRWYTAHREHAYQRLVDRGWRHREVTFLYFAVNVLVVLPAAWFSRDSAAVQACACIAVVTILSGIWVTARQR